MTMIETTGSIILNDLSSVHARQRVAAYLARFARNIPRERIPGLLASAPVVLTHHTRASVARTVVRDLEQMGASAIFVPSRNGKNKQRLSTMLPLLHRREMITSMTSTFLQQVEQADAQSVLLTSCRRGEGKSTVGLNLVQGLVAEAGLRVLLVDANGDGSILHRVLGVQRSPGLTDFLTSERSCADIVRYHDQYGFSYITYGTNQSGWLVPFTGPRIQMFARLLRNLRKRFDYIILDGSALSGPSDPLLIAPQVDGIMLVVACGQTPVEVVEAGEQRLSRPGVRVLGAILNRRIYHVPERLH